MKTLDLHGVKHEHADEKTRRFLNFADLPCLVITGNSTQMKNIVRKIVSEYDWFCREKDTHNCGTLVIMEKEI